jgi:tetraacyldisaccharide 4'-kinase
LRRADAVIFTNANEATAGEMEARRALRRANFSALLFSAALESKFFENLTSGEAAPISFLQGKKVFAACGIARPGRFFEELKKLGMNLVGHAAFPDHHLFKKDQITNLLLRARAATADAVVLTEKDAPKWMAVISEPALPVFLLRMEFRVTADADLLTAKILRSCRSAAHDAAANL